MTRDALPWWSLASAAFALAVVVVEVLGSILGDAPTTSYPGWAVPLAWPTSVRTAVWVGATTGVVASNRGIARATGRPRILLTGAAALPFAAFTVGVAAGADWAAWH